MALREELVLAYKVMVEGEEKLVQLSATERKAMQEFINSQKEQQAAVKESHATTQEWGTTLDGLKPKVGSMSDALGVLAGGLGAFTLATAAATGVVRVFSDALAAGREREELTKTFTALTRSTWAAEAQMRHWEDFSLHADFGTAAIARSAAQMELFGLDAQTVLPSVARAADALGVSVEEMSQALNMALLGQTKGLKRYGIDAQEIARDTGIQLEGAGKLTRDQMEQVVTAIVQGWDSGLGDTEDTISDHLQHIENRFTVFAGRAFHDTTQGPINEFLAGIESILDALDQIPEKAHAAAGALGFGNFGAYAVPTYMGQQGAEAPVTTVDPAHMYTSPINVGPALNGLIQPGLPGVTDEDLRDNLAQQYLDDQAAAAQAAREDARERASALREQRDTLASVAQSFWLMVLGGESDASLKALREEMPKPQDKPFDAVGRKSPRVLEEEQVQQRTQELEDLGFDHFTAVEYAKEQVAKDSADRRLSIEERHKQQIIAAHAGTIGTIQRVETASIDVLARGTSMLFAHRSKAEKERVSNAKLASMEMQAMVLDEIASELMAKAKKWAIEGAVDIFVPGKQGQGYAELAGAAAAGIASGVFTGLAGNTRARESELAQQARDQAGLGTPGQSQAEREFYNQHSGGGGGGSSGGGGVSYAPSAGVSAAPVNIAVTIHASYFTGTPDDAARVVQDIKGALDQAVYRGELPHVQRAA